MGMIGLLSYAGAAIQEFITGKLMIIEVIDGEKYTISLMQVIFGLVLLFFPLY